jgi:hypothetical protein
VGQAASLPASRAEEGQVGDLSHVTIPLSWRVVDKKDTHPSSLGLAEE